MKKKILAAVLAAAMVMSMTGVPAAAKSKEKSEGTTFVSVSYTHLTLPTTSRV